jgi:hypothetical protein
MKAEDEWSALTSKVAGLEQGYKRTACILALCPLSELADSSISLNPFCKVSIVKDNELRFLCRAQKQTCQVSFTNINCTV